ncbi:MAG TPA: hypothetical protein VMB78_06750 [Dissulfurispiraceae bacterium]|nr:hypothetical protein [Dissulfurispiraceae bacterium]
MKRCSCLQGCFYPFQKLIIPVILTAILSCYAGAQEVPSGDKPEINPSESHGNSHSSSLPSGFQIGDMKAGIFWGDGRMTVDRQVAVSPSPLLFPSGFEHRSITNFNDPFLTFEWGFRLGDIMSATTSVDTNIAEQRKFTQTSTGAQTGVPYNSAMSILALPANTTGIIALDSRNNIWDLNECLAFRVIPNLQLLVGWKYNSISSDIDPYSAAIPANSFPTLPGLTGWTNGWALSNAPSTTGFAMTQRFWWTGPFLGARFTTGTPQKLPGQWYIEGKAVPYAWGTYTFKWSGFFHDDTGGFINGQENTHVGVHGYSAEIKSGMQIKLIGRLFLDLWAKYERLHMSGSGAEGQATQNSYGALNPAYWGVAANYSQQAAQNIKLRENLWGVGPSLVLHF